MSWIKHQINDQSMAYPPAFGGRVVSNPLASSSGATISPAVLFILVILAVLFFVSGLLHLLVRFLVKQQQPSSTVSPQFSRYPEISPSDVLQSQLQQLFHLHDSGLDQAFIDALPVFQYKDIVGGTKEPFDCAVCLSEFLDKDKLRLLPMCSHAFHINCIDTWLLSNSTCPLCRGTVYAPQFPMENAVFDFDYTNEEDSHHKSLEMEETVVPKGVLLVRLGNFQKLDDENPSQGTWETSSSNLDARRCFSMGSYQYVLGKSDLKVPLSQYHQRNRDLQLLKDARSMGESSAEADAEAKKISNMVNGESFSVSKIWLWSKRGKSPSDCQGDMPFCLKTDLPWMQEHKKHQR